MNRRFLLAALACLPATAARAAKQEWQVRLVPGTFDGSAYQAGLLISLAEGWKTYWRVPGEAGIPPQITISGDNLASSSLAFPLPERIPGQDGETLGYHHEMLVLLALTPKDPKQPITATIDAAFGICQEICKPAKFSGTLALTPQTTVAAEQPLLDEGRAKLPREAAFVSSAKLQDKQLHLTLSQPVDDIFVESTEGLYFRKPQFQGLSAQLAVDGLTDDMTTTGLALRLTANAGGKGLEQSLHLP